MRLTSRDGRWRVDLIRLTATSDHRDGEWLRVHCDGFFVAEVRTVAELAARVDLAEMEEASEAGPQLQLRARYQPGRAALRPGTPARPAGPGGAASW